MTYSEELEKLSKEIWELAELKFNEVESAKLQMEFMRNNGFEVVDNLAYMPTAFSAIYGKTGPKIAFLGEFDALSGLSQKADSLKKEELTCGGSGHGCGHHLLGVGAMEAALKLKDYIIENEIDATVIYYGCPGEEGGSGKAFMAKYGVFDDVDVAFSWHPFNHNHVITGSMLSNIQSYVRFKGVSAHAASSPHLGRSALDALELTNIGIQFLREHMEDTDRIHYSILNGGSKSPNVVQAEAEGLYLVRSKNNKSVIELYKRFEDIVKGAALMSGVDYEIEFDKACSNMISNKVLEKLLYEAFLEVGPVKYTEEEKAYAFKFKETYPEINFANQVVLPMVLDPNEEMEYMKDHSLHEKISKYLSTDKIMMGSSDVGDVSNVVPTAQIAVACFAFGTIGHSWEEVAQGKSSIAMKGMHKAGEVLYTAAKKLLKDPDLILKAKEELEKSRGSEFISPIPDNKKPNIKD